MRDILCVPNKPVFVFQNCLAWLDFGVLQCAWSCSWGGGDRSRVAWRALTRHAAVIHVRVLWLEFFSNGGLWKICYTVLRTWLQFTFSHLKVPGGWSNEREDLEIESYFTVVRGLAAFIRTNTINWSWSWRITRGRSYFSAPITKTGRMITLFGMIYRERLRGRGGRADFEEGPAEDRPQFGGIGCAGCGGCGDYLSVAITVWGEIF